MDKDRTEQENGKTERQEDRSQKPAGQKGRKGAKEKKRKREKEIVKLKYVGQERNGKEGKKCYKGRI
jgi:hypothetical protein